MEKLERGQQAKVLQVNTDNTSFACRLAAMGLVLGSEIECIVRGSKSSIYKIHNYMIAIGHSGLNEVLVTVI